MKVVYKGGGILKAPVKGKMNKHIKECINGNVGVALYDKRGKLIYRGKGDNCGLEMVLD